MSCGREDVGIRRNDIIPLAVAAWNHACKPSNIISGFRATGIYPYDPLAYLRTAASHTKSTSLTGCPLLLSTSLAASAVQDSPILANLLRTPSLARPIEPTGETPAAAGAASKQKTKRTLNLSAGMLLTASEVREAVKRREAEKEAEEAAKQQRKLDRYGKRVERVKEAAVRAVKKAEREAAKAAKAAAQPPALRKRVDDAMEAEAEAAGDKENVDPNARAAEAEAGTTARYMCSVKRSRRGDVLRLRACV